jgi:hypothetical protein
METKVKPIIPTLTLLFLAPVTGEILSSSLPPLEFIQPITLLLQLMLYGCGALLIRELKVRKNLGWMAVFLLGMAYGIYEEGVVVRSFFDPAWMDLGFYGTYGRWIGVNWIWTINLTIFHAFVSIMSPLMILDLLFPAYREKPLLKKGGLIAAIIAFALMMPFGILFAMKATLFQLASCFVLMGILFLIALRLPPIHHPVEPKGKPARLFWIALLGSVLFWLSYILVPNLGVPALVSWWLANGTILYYLIITRRLDRLGEAFDASRKARFVFGSLLSLFFFDLLVRLGWDGSGEDMRGLVLFSGLYMIGLIVLMAQKKPQPQISEAACMDAAD